MFIQTEATPNPATLKFIPGKSVAPGPPREYRSPGEAAELPLALRLFEVEGVTGVFLGADFITVTKGQGDWQHLKPAVLGVIMEHYLSGAPVTLDQAAKGEGASEDFAEADAGDRAYDQGAAETAGSGRRWPRMAATSPSRAIATASCS